MLSKLTAKFTDNLQTLINLNILDNPELCQPTIAVAVSGGSDSVALLHLAHSWRDSLKFIYPEFYNKLRLLILTVNHQLRQGSEIENQYVQLIGEQLGCETIILTWKHDGKLHNLQARAREGRYELMTSICNQRQILYLLTAHHQDDYIETLRLKQERDSGLLGLSSNRVSYINNVKLVRPLYNIPKTDLINFLQINKIKWYEDISNYSGKYRRNVIRKSIITKGLEYRNEIAQEQSIIDQEAKSLQPLLVQSIAKCLSINNLGIAFVNLRLLKKQPFEIQLRLLSLVLTIIQGGIILPRRRSVIPLLNELLSFKDLSKTLHGCIIKKHNDTLIVFKELGKLKIKTVEIKRRAEDSSVSPIFWDNRFILQSCIDYPNNTFSLLNNEHKDNIYIDNLNAKDYEYLKQDGILESNFWLQQLTEKQKIYVKNYRKDILFTLPVIKKLEKVLAFPHISYYNDADTYKTWYKNFQFVFYPQYNSRFIHFLDQ